MILDIFIFLAYAFGIWVIGFMSIIFMFYIGINWIELMERFKK